MTATRKGGNAMKKMVVLTFFGAVYPGHGGWSG